jgi:uncharacterized membrane protein YkvA (DUF1232 family)
MPIEITSNELTPNHKKDVRKEFEVILKSLDLKQPEENDYDHLLILIENLGMGRNRLKKELSNYLMAIYVYLNLPEEKISHKLNTVFFDKRYEKQLLAALIYFANPEDVIPDHIAYIGYLDDAYCVNLTLSKQGPEVKDKIEKIVTALTALET